MGEEFLAGADELGGFFGVGTAEDFEEFVFGAVVVDEEVFDLFDEFGLEVGDGLVMREGGHFIGDGDEAVVAEEAAFLGLAGFDDADEAGGNEATREGGLFHEDEDVEGAIVFSPCSRDEAEVEGKDGTSREDFLETEEAEFFVVGEFVSRSPGCLDNGVEEAGFGVEGIEMEEVDHGWREV